MSLDHLLAVIGGIAQALGIAIVALEILSDRHRSVAVARQGRTYNDEAIGRSRATGWAVEEGVTKVEPTIEERLTRLERDTAGFPEQLRGAVENVEDTLRQHVARTADRIDADVYQRDETLRAVLRDKLAGKLWLRSLGIALLLAGVGFSTAAALGAGRGAPTYGGLTSSQARHKAEQAIADLHPSTTLSYKSEAKGSDSSGNDAWLVYLDPLSGFGSAYSGCIVIVNNEVATPTPECSRY